MKESTIEEAKLCQSQELYNENRGIGEGQSEQSEYEVLEQETALKTCPHVCFHCGNFSVMRYMGQTSQEFPIYDLQGRELPGNPIDHENWHIFECPSCHRPIIISSRYSDIDDYPYTVQLKYPRLSIKESGVPIGIYNAYLAAVRARGIDLHICLLSLRRVLEMICKDKGEPKGSLESKIERLIENGTISPIFSDACWIIRQLGNEAAHGDNRERFEHEIEEIIAYVAEIINFLYALPIQAKNTRTQMQNRQRRKE